MEHLKKEKCASLPTDSSTPGNYFYQTFASVTRFSSIRLIVALTTHHGIKIHQLVITPVYSNEKLEKKVYMKLSNVIIEVLETLIERERKASEVRNKTEKMFRERG